jgi:hypothetical protein
MTALIIGDTLRIPMDGSPVAIPQTRRVVLGFEGDALVVLDLANATPAWLEQLRRALDDADPRPVPLRTLRGAARYTPEDAS